MADIASLHRARLDTVVKRDWKGLRALYHPDYTYMDGSGVKGADAAAAVCEAYATAFPDLSLEIRNQYTPGADVSIIEYTARGTHQAELEGIPPTGKHVEVVVCNVIEARDGKIVRERLRHHGGDAAAGGGWELNWSRPGQTLRLALPSDAVLPTPFPRRLATPQLPSLVVSVTAPRGTLTPELLPMPGVRRGAGHPAPRVRKLACIS